MPAAKTWRTWTQKELVLLEERRLAGDSVAHLAARLGRTEASVANRLREEGIKKPRGLSRWLAVLSGPHTIAGAARQMGVTKWAVKLAKWRLRRAGFKVLAAGRGETS